VTVAPVARSCAARTSYSQPPASILPARGNRLADHTDDAPARHRHQRGHAESEGSTDRSGNDGIPSRTGNMMVAVAPTPITSALAAKTMARRLYRRWMLADLGLP
jgi:hypothetical protein